MVILGGIAFTLVALVIMALFLNEYGKEQLRKTKDREVLKRDVQSAMERKNINDLRRIRLMYSSRLEDLDAGMGQRINEYIDELYIEQDDEKETKEAR